MDNFSDSTNFIFIPSSTFWLYIAADSGKVQYFPNTEFWILFILFSFENINTYEVNSTTKFMELGPWPWSQF